MPRVVDHEQRRDELIAAVWQLIADEGLAAVTIRRVAERSGWSSGAVRHYLPTRQAILEAAAQRVAEQIEGRLRAVRADDPREGLVALLAAVLPIDEPMRQASVVWLAFVGQAASDASPDDIRGIVYRDLHTVLVGVLTQAAASGFSVDGGPAAAASELQALVDGLTVHVLLGRVEPDAAQRVLRGAVGRLVTDASAGRGR